MSRIILRTLRTLTLCSLLGGIAPAGNSAEATMLPAVTTSEKEARLAWWREARVGIFIHWGLYAIPARGEWVQWNEQIPNEEYARLAEQFRPTQFDATAWAATFKAAGAKYAVLTARHHDGFALFDDPGNEFTSVTTAAHRDLVAEYVQAIRGAGLRVGLYYSPLDWRFPGYICPDIQLASAEAMRTQYHRQMKELLSNYGKIDILWFDGGETDWLSFSGEWNGSKWEKRPSAKPYHGRFSWRHDEMYSVLRRLQPDVLINGRADMPEDFRSREGDGALGDFDSVRPWELCTTIVNGPWGWKPDAPIKTLHYLVTMLVKAVGRDGNYMLNVGPRPDGQIDPPQAERLRELGAWLGKNGESIYATRGGPFPPGDYGVSTHRGSAVYVHVLQWSGSVLELPALPAKVLRATRLDGGGVSFEQDQHRLKLTVPPGARDAIDTIIKLEIDRPAAGIATIETGK